MPTIWGEWWENLALGRHLIIDYNDCDTSVLNDLPRLESALKEAAIKMWATIIDSNFHQFEPQWVTGVVVLAESHISVHSWPEHGYAAIDIFACWDVDFDIWVQVIQTALQAKNMQLITDEKRWIIDRVKHDSRFLITDNPNWESIYTQSWAWWMESTIDIYDCDPDIIRDAQAIRTYVRELCELIDMKTFGDTQVVHFWEDEKVAWYSMTQLIETSLISWHFANATNAAYLNAFSCKYYDPEVAAQFSNDFFKWDYFKLNVNLRDGK